MAAKKQQSTLAFKNSHTTNKLGKTSNRNPVAKAADETENDEEHAQGMKDEHDDVTMVDGETEETIGKPNQKGSAGEATEDRDGVMVKDEAFNGERRPLFLPCFLLDHSTLIGGH